MDIIVGVSREDINNIINCLRLCGFEKLQNSLSTGFDRFLEESPDKDTGIYAKKFIIQTH